VKGVGGARARQSRLGGGRSAAKSHSPLPAHSYRPTYAHSRSATITAPALPAATTPDREPSHHPCARLPAHSTGSTRARTPGSTLACPAVSRAPALAGQARERLADREVALLPTEGASALLYARRHVHTAPTSTRVHASGYSRAALRLPSHQHPRQPRPLVSLHAEHQPQRGVRRHSRAGKRDGETEEDSGEAAASGRDPHSRVHLLTSSLAACGCSRAAITAVASYA
jgi:hypothetical protein